MKRGEQLNVKFYTNKDNYPCAWIESKKIQGFCLILNQEGLSWLRTYLETGEAEDFGFNPNSVTAYGEGEDKDFQLSIFKQLILAGKALQFVPTFREYGAKITASAFFRKGKIFFRLERTEELNVKPVEELSQFINEAKTPGNLLQDAPDFDAIKQEEYENEGMDVIDVNEEDDNRN